MKATKPIEPKSRLATITPPVKAGMAKSGTPLGQRLPRHRKGLTLLGGNDTIAFLRQRPPIRRAIDERIKRNALATIQDQEPRAAHSRIRGTGASAKAIADGFRRHVPRYRSDHRRGHFRPSRNGGGGRASA